MNNLPLKKIIAVVVGLIIAVIAVFIYLGFFGALQKGAALEQFTIPLGSTRGQITEKLKTEGFIKNEWAFDLASYLKDVAKIQVGAYKISKSMDVWDVAAVFSKGPYMKWVVIPEGLRKEEIADILGSALGWSKEDVQQWVVISSAKQSDYIEGVFFPDTYLIPKDESPANVAKRLQNRFQEKFAPYAPEAVKQNIKWTTLIKVASLIQREALGRSPTGEAAGEKDMPIISGIIWNRLLSGMKLDVDSTLQYAREDTGKGWWAPITSADKKIDSPYNTYLYKGLPPYPICNPGINAIKAALFPAKTDCLYYLHDSAGEIHCAKTYKEHLKNIELYLK